jgi:hypothetical protein
MTEQRQRSMLMCLLTLLAVACGPRVEDDEGEVEVGPDAPASGCEESSCPISCADRTCIGALGIGRCVDEKCSPTPLECVIESRPEETCAEVCTGVGDGVVCVENGCEGATAFGYPWAEIESIMVCGESTPDIRAGVTHIEGPCDAPLVFTGDGSFELYQCCCDHPDY